MEFFKLLWLNLVVSVKNAVEYGRVVRRYYSSPTFRKADLSLLSRYLFKNPYRISKRFLSEHGADDIYAYGETPLTSMERIARECGIQPTDCVFELGCGRGRTCFWLHTFLGCRSVGIEFIPQFIECAEAVRKKYGLVDMEFRLEDMLKSDLSGATVVYLYGTSYDEAFIFALIEKFEKLPKGTRLITVSYSLEEFGSDAFILQRCFPVSFTWGIGDVYLQVRK